MERVTTMLEDRMRVLVDALNNNDREAYEDMHDKDFQAVVVQPIRMNAEEYLDYLFVERPAIAPNAHLEITNLATTVDLQRGSARMFMEFDVSGVHEGVVHQSVAVIKFRIGDDGKWRSLKYEAADSARHVAGI